MTGLYINAPNIYLCLLKNRGVLNFKAMLDFCSTIGKLKVKKAYTVSTDTTQGFEDFLTNLEFDVVKIPFKYPHLAYHLFDSDMTVDILADVHRLKLKKVIIVTSTSNHTKLIRLLNNSGVKVIMLGSTNYLHNDIGVRHFRIVDSWILK